MFRIGFVDAGEVGRITFIIKTYFLIFGGKEDVSDTYLCFDGIKVEITTTHVEVINFRDKTKSCEKTQNDFLLVLAFPFISHQPIQYVGVR